MTDTKHMRRVAEAATPGPWKVTVVEGKWTVRARYKMGDGFHNRWPATCPMATGAEQDATHIATFDPPAIHAIADEIDGLREALTDARRRLVASGDHFGAGLVTAALNPGAQP